jgi:hypothetical protein
VQNLSNYAPAAEIGSLLSDIEHNLPISATSGTIVRLLIAGGHVHGRGCGRDRRAPRELGGDVTPLRPGYGATVRSDSQSGVLGEQFVPAT